MISFKNMAIVAASLVALAGCAKPGPSAADDTAVRAVNPAWFKAYNAGDADAISALYADDAVLNMPGAAAARGRAAIREAYVKDMAASASAGVANNQGAAPEFGVASDMAWEWNTFTVTNKSGATVDTGKYVTVYAKKDGKWLIVRDIWNSDAAPAPAPTKTVVVTVQVNDAAKWEAGFRTHADLFKSEAVVSPIHFAVNAEKKEVAVAFTVADLDKFMAGMNSKETADAMAIDGVKRESRKIFLLDKELALN